MEEELYEILARLCEEPRILNEPELELLDSGLLDSFGLICLLETLEDRYALTLHPTQHPRRAFGTPGEILRLVEDALQKE